MTQDASQDAARQLRDLCAEPTVFTTAAGERVEVAPLKVRQLGAFARAVGPLIEDLSVIATMPAGDQAGAFGSVVVRHCDEVAQAVASATGRTAEWVGNLDLDDLVGLAGVVVEVNADFFVRRLLPVLETTLPEVAGRIQALTAARPSAAQTQQPAGLA